MSVLVKILAIIFCVAFGHFVMFIKSYNMEKKQKNMVYYMRCSSSYSND